MWGGIPDDSVLLFDRGFIDTGRMHELVAIGSRRHFVTRELQTLTWKTVEALGEHDSLVDVQVSEAAMRADNQVPSTLRLRRIEYTIPGHEPSALSNSLLCPKAYAAAEIVALYHERWNLELSYRYIKQAQLQRMESLRSRTPEGVEQEIWGLLTAYQLVRQRMLVVARKLDKAPRRLSFKTSLMAIHAFCIQMTVPLRAPERPSFALEILDATIASGLMPPRRTDRRYARHVKVKMSSYKRNRGSPKNSTGSNSKGNA